jgi:hypothetical protein
LSEILKYRGGVAQTYNNDKLASNNSINVGSPHRQWHLHHHHLHVTCCSYLNK